MYTDASEGYGYGVVPELIPEVVPHEKYDCKFLNVFSGWRKTEQFVCRFSMSNKVSDLARCIFERKYSFFTETPQSSIRHDQFGVFIRTFSKYSLESMCLYATKLDSPYEIVSVRANFVYRDGVDGVIEETTLQKQNKEIENKDFTDPHWAFSSQPEFPAPAGVYGLQEIILRISVEEAKPVRATEGLPGNDHLFRKFRKFYLSDHLSDFELRAGGQKFPTHRIILAGSSPVLFNAFKHGTKESTEEQMEIQDITGEAMREVLEYMYSGTCASLETKAEDMLATLFRLSDRFLMDDLRAQTANAICSIITGENALRLWDLAVNFKQEDILEALKVFCWTERAEFDVEGSNLRQLIKSCYPNFHCMSSRECTFCSEK